MDSTTREALAHLNHMTTTLQSQMDMAVGAAKATGATWAEIGAIMGTTKQAAQQRWGWTAANVEDEGDAARWMDPKRWSVTEDATLTPKALGGYRENRYPSKDA